MHATVTLRGERGGGGEALGAIDGECVRQLAERGRHVRHQVPADSLRWVHHHPSQLGVGDDPLGVLHVAQRQRGILLVARDHGFVKLEHFAAPGDIHGRGRGDDTARGAHQAVIHAA